MSVTIHSQFEFIAQISGEELFPYADKLMHALLEQEECTPEFSDSAVAADADRSVVEIEANAVGGDLSQAIAVVHACVRAAIHEVGFGTPHWPTHDESLSMVLSDLRTETVA
jgi:hypothetical protein